MAIVSNPLIGKARKSVGNATFSTWKGLNILKEKPLTVANPRTDRQMNQRGRFALLIALYAFIASAVKVGFKQRAIEMSEFNAFISNNLKNGSTTVTAGVASLVPNELVISDGTMMSTPSMSVAQNITTDEIELNWSNTNIGNQLATDQLCFVVYSKVDDQWEVHLREAERSTGEFSYQPGFGVNSGNPVYCWVFFQSADYATVSDSQYFNLTV